LVNPGGYFEEVQRLRWRTGVLAALKPELICVGATAKAVACVRMTSARVVSSASQGFVKPPHVHLFRAAQLL
jgi:hypothetical protein